MGACLFPDGKPSHPSALMRRCGCWYLTSVIRVICSRATLTIFSLTIQSSIVTKPKIISHIRLTPHMVGAPRMEGAIPHTGEEHHAGKGHALIENRCFKDLCIRISPEVSRFNSVMEEDKMSISGGPSSTKDFEWTNLKIEHRVYGKLAHELIGPPMKKNCIYEPICASSTDNYPDESIVYTLDPRDREGDRPSYWSSKGDCNRDVSETLTYRLHMNLSVVHEVKIHPFKAYFQMGSPIYSANKVRFRFGYCYSSSSPGFNSSLLDGSMSTDRSPCEDYVWTYISQEYPVVQEDELQSFKLPRPVLCIGDILQVELLGRVQKQEMDGLYYICVRHVYVVGRPISSISFEVQGQPRQYVLKYSEHLGHPDMPFEDTSRVASQGDQTGTSSDLYPIVERIRQIRAGRVLAAEMLENIAVVNFIPPDDQDSDEDDNINSFSD